MRDGNHLGGGVRKDTPTLDVAAVLRHARHDACSQRTAQGPEQVLSEELSEGLTATTPYWQLPGAPESQGIALEESGRLLLAHSGSFSCILLVVFPSLERTRATTRVSAYLPRWRTHS